MARVYIALSFLLFGVLLASSAAASVSIGFTGISNITWPGDAFTGTIQVVHDALLPANTVLSVLVNTALKKTTPLSFPPLASYFFTPQRFSYELRATGSNSWTIAPQVLFTYKPFVNYTCVNVNCQCPAGQASCTQAISATSLSTYVVSANDGLKLISNTSLGSLTVPDGVENVQWAEIGNTNESIRTTMRAACSGQTYAGRTVDPDGFVRRRLLCTANQCSQCAADPAQCTGAALGCSGALCPASWTKGSNFMFRNIEPFDNESLGENRNFLGGGLGGVYKKLLNMDAAYLSFEDGSLVWNGSTGFIQLFNYDPNAVYDIVYLPPNGPVVCAKSTFLVEKEQAWTKVSNEGNQSVTLTVPYSRTYSDLATRLAPGECPDENRTCIQQTLTVDAVETFDPASSVAFTYYPATRTVNATTSAISFSQNYTLAVNLTALNITSNVSGQNNLTFIFSSGSTVLARFDRQAGVCTDRDGDSYCAEADDCNDFNRDVHPGAAELCDGLDNNCNNAADETFSVPGSQLGAACNNWVGSACAGIIACTANKTGTACSGKVVGSEPEICGDTTDNNCNGLIDETAEDPSLPGCLCKDGASRACGSSTGVCKPGIQLCLNGVWSGCLNDVKPSVETCNRLDDNCDTVVDNLGALNGQQSTDSSCACANGKPPLPETCNGIDDNCNGKIDDGISCSCKNGDLRACGASDAGICSKGVQSCVNGDWGGCEGAVNPKSEICFNEIDENCDGTVDENCGSASTYCRNGIQDSFEQDVDCGGPCTPCGETQAALTLLTVFAAAIGLIILLYVVSLVRAGKKEELTYTLPFQGGQ